MVGFNNGSPQFRKSQHRVLVFPNDPLQHCVAGLKNIAPGEEIPNEKPRIEESDGEKENTDNESQTEPEDYSEHPLSATRKILCFFLVNGVIVSCVAGSH